MSEQNNGRDLSGRPVPPVELPNLVENWGKTYANEREAFKDQTSLQIGLLYQIRDLLRLSMDEKRYEENEERECNREWIKYCHNRYVDARDRYAAAVDQISTWCDLDLLEKYLYRYPLRHSRHNPFRLVRRCEWITEVVEQIQNFDDLKVLPGIGNVTARKIQETQEQRNKERCADSPSC